MFDFLVNIFNAFLYQPLFNLLILIYNLLPKHDFGLAIIFLTIIIRIILYPLSIKTLNSQKALQKLQPKTEEIKKKFKDDKERQARETLELYRKEKINPFSGLFLVIIQFPVLIALYTVFNRGLKPEELGLLYSFIANPIQVNSMFFNIINLAKPNLIFAILASILQFFQTKMLMPKKLNNQLKETNPALMMQKQMVYVFPIITIIILINLPSALSLYWIVSGIFSIIQQYFVLKKIEPAKP